MEGWIATIPNWVMATMLGYNIIVIKKLIEKTIESSRDAHDRISIHDRAVSELNKIAFDSAAIAKHHHHFPVFHKPKRDS